MYHVLSRGDRREDIFLDDVDRRDFGELGRLGWSETELATRRKSDPAKLAIGARIRRETTLSIKAIASRVRLGASKGAHTNLHKWMRDKENKASAQEQLGM